MYVYRRPKKIRGVAIYGIYVHPVYVTSYPDMKVHDTKLNTMASNNNKVYTIQARHSLILSGTGSSSELQARKPVSHDKNSNNTDRNSFQHDFDFLYITWITFFLSCDMAKAEH
uniref:Uncharacterized protein n=1 Tax=Cacopsylla melanoneura TaxID=428564 RepID=A0A8D9F5F5_9HEMI